MEDGWGCVMREAAIEMGIFACIILFICFNLQLEKYLFSQLKRYAGRIRYARRAQHIQLYIIVCVVEN